MCISDAFTSTVFLGERVKIDLLPFSNFVYAFFLVRKNKGQLANPDLSGNG